MILGCFGNGLGTALGRLGATMKRPMARLALVSNLLVAILRTPEIFENHVFLCVLHWKIVPGTLRFTPQPLPELDVFSFCEACPWP